MHRWSQLFIPTLREAPADAEVASHKLLLRAGYIRQLGSGIYSHLFLGNRAINKIVAIVREEMDTIGQEMHLPALNPREVWEESGRWAGMGGNMFRLKDRKGAELCLAMTHEEVMTSIARSELRSYKQLPQIWYQIQTKFRDELRPKSGLLRVRQFLMKDAYSFDIDEAGLDASYAKHDQVYRNIFSRCGLDAIGVEADSGSMGGSESKEFMVYTNAGEDSVIYCKNCKYSANREKAEGALDDIYSAQPETIGLPVSVETPGVQTISEISKFFGVRETQVIKAVAYLATYTFVNCIQEIPVVAFVRGDRDVNETKVLNDINKHFSGATLQMLSVDDLLAIWGVPAGFLGPFNIPKAKLARPTLKQPHYYFDPALQNGRNLIAGGNAKDRHYKNIDVRRDLSVRPIQLLTAEKSADEQRALRLLDVLMTENGDPCPRCGEPIREDKAVEIGHIFKLGYKYSKSMGASVLNRDGKETTPIMGSYGIGIERILTAAIEQSAAKFAAQSAGDAKASESYALPPSIAPFQVVVTITNVREAELLAAGEKIAADLSAAGIDVLLDDRDERAGVKFKDAELIGVPFRIAVGKKLVEGKVELLNRLTNQTDDIPIGEAVQQMQAALKHFL
jgi:prolyl-tRNA synthetase